MTEPKEIVIAEEVTTDVPAIADDNLVAIAEKAEKRIDAINKIKRVALKVTNHNDWIDQNGRPYLQTSGAEKVARLFGISWRIDEPEFVQEEDGHFSYTYKGYFSLQGVTIEAIGTRSSKDGFFKKYDYSQKDENGKPMKVELPPSEIDKGDVKKAAYTNCIGNGITRLLGIRNLTYDDLKEAGIDVSKITQVEYKTKGRQKTAPKPANPNEPATEAQLRKMFSMFRQLGLQDSEEIKDWIRVNMKYDIQSSKELTKGQTSEIIDVLNKKLNGELI